MPDKTCKLIELVGVSEESVHQASHLRARTLALVDSNSTRTESCVAIRPDPKA
jgi:flavin-binding protein dodecin